jgi:hypothetical protein
MSRGRRGEEGRPPSLERRARRRRLGARRARGAWLAGTGVGGAVGRGGGGAAHGPRRVGREPASVSVRFAVVSPFISPRHARCHMATRSIASPAGYHSTQVWNESRIAT